MEKIKIKLTNRERKRGNHSSLFSVELRELSLQQLLKESFFIMTMRFVAEILIILLQTVYSEIQKRKKK